MKNVYLFIVLFFMLNIFSSCIVIPNIEHSEYTYSVDLRKYSAKNFLFTSDGYSGKYKSCGFIEGGLYPEVKERPRFDSTFNENLHYKVGAWYIEKINVDEIINNIYKKALSMDADAVINLKIVKKRNSKLNMYPELEKALKGISDGYFISGFAIKRID